jgi:N-acetylglucosaminyldiphosphoundecaprenol N-acetyl-beta-D-mannosaminyltransferase
MTLPEVQILGVTVHPVTVAELNQCIAELVQSGAHAVVANVNAHFFNLAYRQPELRRFQNAAELVFCDGAGVMLAARILGQRIPQRITYADWIWQLAEFAEPQGFSFFFLGARPGIAQRGAERLCARFPHLRVVGTQHGFFDRTPGGVENQAVIARINALQPDILLLGMGMPLQERWLMQNWARVRARVALTGGAVFDYLAGELPRAPRWLTDHGLEWLGRLAIEPRRLWRRYLLGNPLFLWHVLQQRTGRLHLDQCFGDPDGGKRC